jgi:hypothetical protein
MAKFRCQANTGYTANMLPCVWLQVGMLLLLCVLPTTRPAHSRRCTTPNREKVDIRHIISWDAISAPHPVPSGVRHTMPSCVLVSHMPMALCEAALLSSLTVSVLEAGA